MSKEEKAFNDIAKSAKGCGCLLTIVITIPVIILIFFFL